jgi:hypothetical protein
VEVHDGGVQGSDTGYLPVTMVFAVVEGKDQLEDDHHLSRWV